MQDYESFRPEKLDLITFLLSEHAMWEETLLPTGYIHRHYCSLSSGSKNDAL